MPAYDLGYDVSPSMRVMNGTTTLLKKGEAVVWDTTTPVSTDKARRVRRSTIDNTLDFAGICLNDIPVSGGYGTIAVGPGLVRARVNAAVTAQQGLTVDFVTGTIGILQSRSVGNYGLVAMSQQAATLEGGAYWANVMLLGPNAAAMQEIIRGGGMAKKVMHSSFIGAAVDFIGGILVAPCAGSITNVVFVATVAVAGADTSNMWEIQIRRIGGTGPIIPVTGGVPFGAGGYRTSTAGGAPLGAGVPVILPAGIGLTNVVLTSGEVLEIVFDLTGAPGTTAATRFEFWLEIDTGLSTAAAYGL